MLKRATSIKMSTKTTREMKTRDQKISAQLKADSERAPIRLLMLGKLF